jgi:1,4-dihydroxy-2-naphthoate polyprenyltransferase
MSTVAKWLKVSRAPFLTASVMPVLVGTSLAWATTGQFHGEVFTLALFGMIFFHAGANLANEYFDHILGADKLNPRPSPLFGGSGSIQAGLVPAKNVRIAAIICLAIGSAMGLAIVILTRQPLVLIVGLIGILGSWFYTCPPVKLAYRTFGELNIALQFGILPVWTSYYIQTAALDLVPLIPALITAILIFEIILANEFPDAPTDSAAGKRTIVVRFGARPAAIIYTVAMAAAYLLGAAAILDRQGFLFPWLMFLATSPLALRAILNLYSETLKGLPRFGLNTMTIVLYHLALLVLSLGMVAAKYLELYASQAR